MRITVLFMVVVLLATASCKKNESNVVSTLPVATQSSILRGFGPGDVLTYYIEGSKHSISYNAKEYHVSAAANSTADMYDIIVSGEGGHASGTVTVSDGKATYVHFDTRPTMNTIFESSSYR